MTTSSFVLELDSVHGAPDLLLVESPDIYNWFPFQVEFTIAFVRRTEHQNVAALDHLIHRKEILVVGYQRIRSQHFLSVRYQYLLHFVTERGASVIDLSLKSHSKQSDG